MGLTIPCDRALCITNFLKLNLRNSNNGENYEQSITSEQTIINLKYYGEVKAANGRK